MNETQNAMEIRRMRRLLNDLSEIAQHASMTGSLAGGAASGVRRYNMTLKRLEELGAVPAGLFEQLREDTSFDELGIESKLLSGSLEEFEDSMAPPPPSPPSPPQPPLPPGAPHGNVIIGLGGMKELNDLRDLGKVIREQLPAWMRGNEYEEREREREEREREREQRRSEREERRRARANGQDDEPDSADLSGMESQLVEIGVKMQAVAEQMRRGDLSDTERADLADQLSRLGQEQANLARQNAKNRE